MSEASIFTAALEKNDAEERAEYVAEACAGDEKLRRRVEALLRAHREPDEFLDPSKPNFSTVDYAPLTEGPGTVTVAGYEILGELGRGGMGVVYKARQTKLGRTVALKMILAGSHAGSAQLQRFGTEAEAIARLQHPNIVQIHEVGEQSGLPYFSLEFCAGGSLEKKLAGTPLPPKEAAALVETLARAMQVAHEAGVIHRDLKPANILLSPLPAGGEGSGATGLGTPKITDFGLAKKLDEAGRTATGAVMGTPSYMAPEQAGGKSKELGPACDVYALGAILYECLTGRPPFRAATVMDTLMQVLNDEPVAPRQLQSTVPPDLETICEKCLAKSPSGRYATARELAEDLRRHLAGEPIRARPVGSPERFWRWCKRKPALATANVAVVVAAVTFATAFFVVRESLTNEEIERAKATNLASEKSKLAEDNQKIADDNKKIADDNKRIADENREQLWRSWTEQARAERLSGNRQRSLELIGKALAMKSTPELQLEAARTITSPGVRMVLEIPVGHVGSMKFSADGTVLAVHGIFGEDANALARKDPPQNSNTLKTWRIPTGELLAETILNLPNNRNMMSEMNAASPACTVNQVCVRRLSPFVFSPTAPVMALDAQDGGLRLWNAITGKDFAELTGTGYNSSFPHACAFRPDGTHLLWFSHVWDIAEQPPKKLRETYDTGYMTGFTSDSELMVAHNEIFRCNLLTRQQTRTTIEGTYPLAISADFKTGAMARYGAPRGGPVIIWDLVSGKEIATIPNVIYLRPGISGHHYLQFSPDGRRLAFEDPDPDRSNLFYVWDRELGRIKSQMNGAIYGKGHWSNLQRAAFSPNGSLLICYARAETNVLNLWDIDQDRKLAVLNDAHSPVWSGDGRFLATIGSGRACVRVWEVVYPTLTRNIGAPIETLGFHPDGTHLAANNVVFDLPKGKRQILPSPYKPEGNVALFSSDGQLWTMDYPQRETLQPQYGGTRPWKLSRRTPGNPQAAESYLHLRTPGWTLSRFSGGLEVAEFVSQAGTDPLAAVTGLLASRPPLRLMDRKNVTLGPEGSFLVILSSVPDVHPGGIYIWGNEKCLALWDLKTEERKARWFLNFEALWGEEDGKGSYFPGSPCFSLSADAQLLALEAVEGGHHAKIAAVDILDTATGKHLQRIRHPVEIVRGGHRIPMRYSITSLVFSPDKRFVFSGTGGSRINIGDLATELESASWLAHKGTVHALAITPDGQILASGGSDHAIALWDVTTRRELARWEAHEGSVTALAFSADGKTLASGGADGTVTLWDVPLIRQDVSALHLDR